jgi:hypothetical protein
VSIFSFDRWERGTGEQRLEAAIYSSRLHSLVSAGFKMFSCTKAPSHVRRGKGADSGADAKWSIKTKPKDEK